jgi:hypothetical protein
LRGLGIRTCVYAGFASNVCVESTARHGFVQGYYSVLLPRPAPPASTMRVRPRSRSSTDRCLAPVSCLGFGPKSLRPQARSADRTREGRPSRAPFRPPQRHSLRTWRCHRHPVADAWPAS